MPRLSLSGGQSLALGSNAVKAVYAGSQLSYFDPLALGGCVGWYDSSDLSTMAQNSDGSTDASIGDQVGYWADKSGTDAHLIQATGANRPTLTAAAVNGKAALVFDGSNDTLSCADYIAQGGLAGLTRIAVYSTSHNSMALRASNSGDACFFTANTDYVCRVSTTAGVAVEATPAAQMPLRIYANVFDGDAGTCETFFNNALQSTKASPYITTSLPATTPDASGTMYVGSNAGANNFVAGPIAECIIYSRALTTAERTSLYDYLAEKWGF